MNAFIVPFVHYQVFAIVLAQAKGVDELLETQEVQRLNDYEPTSLVDDEFYIRQFSSSKQAKAWIERTTDVPYLMVNGLSVERIEKSLENLEV